MEGTKIHLRIGVAFKLGKGWAKGELRGKQGSKNKRPPMKKKKKHASGSIFN